ncbi:hypothetical protein CR513_33086, partial [Mucuna pruriens]
MGCSSPSFEYAVLRPSSTIVLKAAYLSRSWELCFCCLTSVNCYPLTRPTRQCETSESLLCHSQLLVIMTEDKIVILGPNELPNLYICTTLKGNKKLSHIEGSDPPRDDPKFQVWDDEASLIMT